MIKYKSAYTALPRIFGAKLFLILLAGISISITSCDESSVIGLDVQPPNDLLNVTYIDTTTLVTKTMLVDSLRSDETIIAIANIANATPGENVLLGNYTDPVFGKTTASLYTQVKLSSINPLFGTAPMVDSVVLSMAYSPAYYGKTHHVPQNVNVYQVSEDIKLTTTYFSHNTVTTFAPDDLAANHTFIPAPADSVKVTGQTKKPQLRVPLANTFGQLILDQQGLATLASNSAFQTFMKGFYISTEYTFTNNSEGNIVQFRLSDSESRLTVYYHSTENDSLKFDMPLAGVARFSHFNHGYTSGVHPNLAAQLSSTPPSQNDVVFVQAMGGVKTRIEFPYIMDWIKAGPIAVNRAELVIKADLGSAYQPDTFAAPPRLVLFGIRDDGTNYELTDAGEGDSYYGGKYNVLTHEYRFNIGRYVQEVLTGRLKNNGLDLLVSSGVVNGSRVVLGGGGGGTANTYRMKLNIAYTNLK
ncbi:MAG: DUF4270 domain-containing protein [Bacteroidota bacterium]